MCGGIFCNIMGDFVEMADSVQFKRNFMQLTGEMDCNNTQAAQKIGIDYRIYKGITEHGKIPKPAILIRIADYFDISVEYLLGRTGNRNFERADTPATFYERFTQLKDEKGFTDYKIAQKLHISTSYTSAWKKNSYIPSLDNLIILSEVFKVSLDYLLGRTDEKNLD